VKRTVVTPLVLILLGLFAAGCTSATAAGANAPRPASPPVHPWPDGYAQHLCAALDTLSGAAGPLTDLNDAVSKLDSATVAKDARTLGSIAADASGELAAAPFSARGWTVARGLEFAALNLAFVARSYADGLPQPTTVTPEAASTMFAAAVATVNEAREQELGLESDTGFGCTTDA